MRGVDLLMAEFKSNKAAVLAKYNANKKRTLTMIALKWHEIVGLEITNLGVVDTGLLRTSSRYRINEDDVIVGNTVNYAIYNELGTRKMKARPFLRNSVMNHKGTYKQIAQDNLGSGFTAP